MYLGAHVSSSGGIENAIKNGDRYDINTIQMMPTAPMRWVTKNISDESIESFLAVLKVSGIKKILVHGIYLTNLARGDKQLFHLGKMGLVVYLDFVNRAEERIRKEGIDCDMLGVCFHPGSVKDLSEEESLERVIYGLNWVLKEVGGTSKLLLETTAGSGNVLGDTFEELAKMRNGVDEKERIGYVVDTQHTYASGYDWVNDLGGVLKDLDLNLGLKNIKAIHLNDSMVELGSHKDRHDNLGKGKLGEDTIRKILHSKELKDIPFILETPALKSESSMREEINTLKELSK